MKGNFIILKQDDDLLHKFSETIKTHGFCILKNFVDKNIIEKKLNDLKSSFKPENDLRRTGPYKFKMANFQRLDLGDFAQINARFSRMLSQFTWNQNSIFLDEINQLIEFRNKYCKLSNHDFVYDLGGSKFCDLPKLLHYPIGGGFMNQHKDGNNEYAVMNFLLTLTKKGIDYEKGGAYYIDKHGKFIDADEILDIGDIYAHDQNTLHGVHAVDPSKPLDLLTMNGRCSINLSLEKFEFPVTK